MLFLLLADSKVFTGSSTGQVTSINDRDDIVRLEELNLGLCLPHGCGTDETRVQLFRNKALVDSGEFFNDAICIEMYRNDHYSCRISYLRDETEVMRALRAQMPVRKTS